MVSEDKYRTFFYISTYMEGIFYHFVPSLIGKSSLGRLGLFLQITADLGNLGAIHKWTLELKAVQPVKIYPLMRIGQVTFWDTQGDKNMRYDGKYAGLMLVASLNYLGGVDLETAKKDRISPKILNCPACNPVKPQTDGNAWRRISYIYGRDSSNDNGFFTPKLKPYPQLTREVLIYCFGSNTVMDYGNQDVHGGYTVLYRANGSAGKLSKNAIWNGQKSYPWNHKTELLPHVDSL